MKDKLPLTDPLPSKSMEEVYSRDNLDALCQDYVDALNAMDGDSLKYAHAKCRMHRCKELPRERKNIFLWLYITVSIWLFLVFVTVFCSGFEFFYLPSAVLIALLAATAVMIVGIAFTVLKQLFPNSHE